MTALKGTAPLPEAAARWLHAHDFQPATMHAGLRHVLFDRYQREAWTIADEAKAEWLGQFNCKAVGEGDTLTRWRRWLVDRVERDGGRWGVFRNRWRFATGLGLPHPLENGFAWHPTWGVPYLPGAAVKGLARAWFDAGWAEPPAGAEEMSAWFGRPFPGEDGSARGSAASGGWIFFDALPVEPVKLRVDIVTPHQQDWYTLTQPRQPLDPAWVPGDWHAPRPIPFLVTERAALLVAIAPRRRDANPAAAEAVWDGLTQALATLGAGAKTAIGYGSFTPDKEWDGRIRQEWAARRAAQERTARLAAIADPLERQLAALEDAVHATQPDKARWLIWWEALNEERWQGCERVRVARRLQAELARLDKWPEVPPKKPTKDWTRAEKVRRWIAEGEDCP